jgi:hypothetical protein
MRFFQILLINDIIDSFSSMSSYIFSLSILKKLIMLNSEILSFNFLLKFFSLPMINCWLFKTFIIFCYFFFLFSSYYSSTLIKSIFKLIFKIIFISLFYDLIWYIIRHIWLFFYKIIFIKCFCSMVNLMFGSTFLTSKSKTYSKYSIGIFRITSSRIFIKFRRII